MSYSQRFVSDRAELLELLRTKAYREGTFTLASGKQSDFFIDCKAVMLTGRGHLLAGQVLYEMILERCFGRSALAAVAGVDLGGFPLASAVSLTSAVHSRWPLDALYVRKQAKDHGTKRLIEGPAVHEPTTTVAQDERSLVVLVEDVVTAGGSALRAIETLRAHGFEVPLVFALVDRLEGGRAVLEAAGVQLVSVFTRADFVPRPSP